MMLELKRLSVDDGLDIYTMLQEIPAEENGLINKANGLTFDEYKEWLIVKQRDSEQEGIVDGWKVPSTTFWLYADGIPVGFGSVRHFLTETLRKAGGNIGYGIAPAFRGKGYGKELLRLLLNEAKEMGIDKVLVTILLDNIASQAVAIANGGVVTERTDERVFIWIDTKK
ncbi:GNAT family N-acetyltransferase [Hominenteromicrobium sp.]|jgi:predicted acetyltransferase|uniref:GNAT family N-acetyltransferase n=1 Tax=Hominenteromicrobium sp. TaxID=3073581 RepID=UPI003A8D115D